MIPADDLKKVRLEDNRMISPTTGVLRFRRFFTFTAGQVVSISTSSVIAPRMYSICSSEQDVFTEILYKIIPAGELTPGLAELKAGMKLWVSKPFGSFTTGPGPAFLIATGTGIAPYLSMIRSGYSDQKTVLHGSRSPEDFYYQSYLREVLKDRYIPCYSGTLSSQYYKGRVSAYLATLPQLSPNIKYYLCGSAEMVVDTRDLLIKRGIPFRQILSEIYF